MSVRILNELFENFSLFIEKDKNEFKIKIIEIANDCEYKIILEIEDVLYSIHHFEPRVMIQDVNYGMGPYYEYYIEDKDTLQFTKLKK
jgi:hypothetical protein